MSKSFRQVREDSVKVRMHFLTFIVQWSGGKDNVGGSAESSEVTLTFLEKSVIQMVAETIEKNGYKDVPGNSEQRDFSVNITDSPVPFLLVEMDDCRIIEVLRNWSLLSHS
ncbi:hypothetical protein SprV_0100219500 [Sparganum proliferum]